MAESMKDDKPAPPKAAPEPPPPPPPGHKIATPEERTAVVLALMEFHKGMHPTAQLVINDARAVLDFTHDKTPA
jgi:hypothetical protein